MSCFQANNLLSFPDDMFINYTRDTNMSKTTGLVDMFLRRVQNMDMSGILKKNFPGTKIRKNLEVLGYGG